jgi:hypothetical protein
MIIYLEILKELLIIIEYQILIMALISMKLQEIKIIHHWECIDQIMILTQKNQEIYF